MWQARRCAPGVPGRVEVMRGRVELRREVALRADRVARRAQLRAVRLVAVAAGHALRVHAAREERAPVVDLVALLAVGVIEAGRQQRRHVVIRERLAGVVAVGELAAARVALRADVDLRVRSRAARCAPHCRSRVDRPVDAAAFVELDRRGRCAASPRPAGLPQRSPARRAREPGPWQASQPTLISDHGRRDRCWSPRRSSCAGPSSGSRRTCSSSSAAAASSAVRRAGRCARPGTGGTSAARPGRLAARPRRPRGPARARPAIRPGTAAAGTRRRRGAPRSPPGLPSGPSVRTRYLPSRRKKPVVTPKLRKRRVVEVAEHGSSLGDLHGHGVLRALPAPDTASRWQSAQALRSDVGGG